MLFAVLAVGDMRERVEAAAGFLEDDVNVFLLVIHLAEEDIHFRLLDPLDGVLKLLAAGRDSVPGLHHRADFNAQLLEEVRIAVMHGGDAQVLHLETLNPAQGLLEHVAQLGGVVAQIAGECRRLLRAELAQLPVEHLHLLDRAGDGNVGVAVVGNLGRAAAFLLLKGVMTVVEGGDQRQALAGVEHVQHGVVYGLQHRRDELVVADTVDHHRVQPFQPDHVRRCRLIGVRIHVRRNQGCHFRRVADNVFHPRIIRMQGNADGQFAGIGSGLLRHLAQEQGRQGRRDAACRFLHADSNRCYLKNKNTNRSQTGLSAQLRPLTTHFQPRSSGGPSG